MTVLGRKPDWAVLVLRFHVDVKISQFLYSVFIYVSNDDQNIVSEFLAEQEMATEELHCLPC